MSSRLLVALLAVSAGTACSRASATATPSADILMTTAYGLEAEVALGEMTRHPRGFLYRVTVEGTGRPADAGRTVQIGYVMRLADGREVDRTEGDATLTFRVGDGSMIAAVDAAVRDMREGETRQLVIPPRLGYGVRGRGQVPPNAVLVMMMTLLRVR